MKVVIVPAQVTTIEDRITGRLGVNQLILLIVPVFLDSALYVILPPFFHYATYKLVVMLVLFIVCSLFAIRIRNRLVLLWLIILTRYALRPRYYVYDKNNLYVRDGAEHPKPTVAEAEVAQTRVLPSRLSPLTIAEAARTLTLINNSASQLSFETTKKGGLYVRIHENKE